MSDYTYDVKARQVATNAFSAAARLDRATEDRLYRLYRAFFRTAEEDRRWSVWADVDWEQAGIDPSAELVDAVLQSYREDLFLPDYSARALQILRASRGRAWFLTRWSYEEGKHMLTLNEWLLRSGALDDVQIREYTEAHLQAFRWEPPYTDGITFFADMLLWEIGELRRYSDLRARAAEAGDTALETALGFVTSDERAHRDFFRTALSICAETYPELVMDAIGRVAEVQEFAGGAAALSALMAIPGAH